MDASNVGRTYHSAEAPYALPDDERDRNRLDEWHASLKEYFGSNFRAPLENPSAILDLGAGSGIWAAEMAQQFPEATVLGVDISPVMSRNHPKNCSFSQVNLAKDWPFDPETFDIIHTRIVLVHLPNAREIIKKSISALKPGGVLLLEEASHRIVDDETPVGPGIKQFVDLYSNYMDARGVEKDIAQKNGCPLGAWTKDEALDRLGVAFGLFAIGGYSALKASSGVTREVIDELVPELRAEDRKLYVPMCWLWAKKKL